MESMKIIADSLEDYYLCKKCHEVLQEFNEFKTKWNQYPINDLEFRARYQFKQVNDVASTKQDGRSEDQPLLNETGTQFDRSSDTLRIQPSNIKIDDTSNKISKTKPTYVRDRRKLPCHVCGKLVSNAAYTVHVALHNDNTERFTCPICNRSYRQNHNLTKHLNTHTKKIQLPCQVENCGKIFDVASTLRKHSIIMHSNKRDHECNICGRKFAIASGLKGHMRTTHCTKKVHACSECGKMFKTPGEVKLHQKIHTKRHPYDCPECGQAFPKAAIMKEHRASVHNFPDISVFEER
ncbi:zinc finger protein 43 [Aedes albopictus]|uniref:C2H2-type domain-containing protein n=1 Tax=Aedes albopictus TaxID=7160 RepID=A0ABM2A219_AEDAL